MSKRGFIIPAGLAALVVLFVLITRATVIPRNPTKEELVRTWVGWFDDQRYFRLELGKSGDGLFGDYSLTDVNPTPRLYRVAKWSLEGATLAFDLRPVDSDSRPLALNASASVTMLHLKLAETNGWTCTALLRPEREVETAVQETKRQMENYKAPTNAK
jgi:hypothetical protein